MFNINQVRVLHLEPTTVCNAACPQCGRENPNMYIDSRDRSEISLEQIKQTLSIEFIQNLDKMFMCGNYGEPAAAQDCLEIFRYFRSINPDISLGMNTNGGVQNTNWWAELGKIFNQKLDYCVFSIDGLEDTNHIYRVNVRWDKLIKNAQAFIQAGGHAHWDMLIFKHNEHQINDAQSLAKQLGFTHFRSKVSKRFVSKPINGLEPPDEFSLPNVSEPKQIDCYALTEKSLYLAADGNFYPCCWVGGYAFTMDNSLKELLNYPTYSRLVDSWSNNPPWICSNTCGTITKDQSSFVNQWTFNKVLA